MSVDPGSSVFAFDVPVMYYAPLRMALTENIDGNDVLLASGVMSKTGTYNFNVASQTGNLTLSFCDDVPHVQPIDNSLPYLWFVNPRWTETVTTPQTVVTQICNGGKDAYEFGFNGQMKTNEIAGIGNTLDFGARMYNPRLGRWMSLDPKAAKYPSLGPYAFAGNSPIVLYDPNGEEIRNAYYNYSKDGNRLGLINPDVQDLADFVDKTIESFKKDDPLAFEYFNQFDIVVQTGDLPEAANGNHFGHSVVSFPEAGKTLTAEEAYEQQNGQ